jgi:hypothetical protein
VIGLAGHGHHRRNAHEHQHRRHQEAAADAEQPEMKPTAAPSATSRARSPRPRRWEGRSASSRGPCGVRDIPDCRSGTAGSIAVSARRPTGGSGSRRPARPRSAGLGRADRRRWPCAGPAKRRRRGDLDSSPACDSARWAVAQAGAMGAAAGDRLATEGRPGAEGRWPSARRSAGLRRSVGRAGPWRGRGRWRRRRGRRSGTTCRPRRVLADAPTAFIELGQVELAVDQAQVGGLAEPAGGGGRVPFAAFALEVVEARLCMARGRRPWRRARSSGGPRPGPSSRRPRRSRTSWRGRTGRAAGRLAALRRLDSPCGPWPRCLRTPSSNRAWAFCRRARPRSTAASRRGRGRRADRWSGPRRRGAGPAWCRLRPRDLDVALRPAIAWATRAGSGPEPWPSSCRRRRRPRPGRRRRRTPSGRWLHGRAPSWPSSGSLGAEAANSEEPAAFLALASSPCPWGRLALRAAAARAAARACSITSRVDIGRARFGSSGGEFVRELGPSRCRSRRGSNAASGSGRRSRRRPRSPRRRILELGRLAGRELGDFEGRGRRAGRRCEPAWRPGRDERGGW